LCLIFLLGCQAQVPTASDYGMTREQMEQTPSYAIEYVRNARVTPRQYAPNGYDVSLPGFQEVAVAQEGRDWCWAACLQMVSRYNGTDVDQEDIVRKIRGHVRRDGRDAGSVMDMMRGLWGPWRTTFVSNGSNNWIVSDLLFDSPVLVSLRPGDGDSIGHVVVLTGAQYSYGPKGEKIAHEFEIYDPVDGAKRDASAETFRKRIDAVVHFRAYNRA
jgi:hypothetical protein